jgi:glycosyltransferase involved in cell wall biosynthesis
VTDAQTPAETPHFSIVLPVYNEEEYLTEIVDSYLAMLGRLGATHELVLVTNGCRDNSPALARELAEQHPEVVAIDLPVGGWGRAVRAGLAVARGDNVCYTNLARTSAQTLGLLLAYHLAFPDVVVKASRKMRDSFRRRMGSLIYNLECRALFDTAVWDVNGTPKVFPRRFEQLLELQREDDLIDAEFVARCRSGDYPIVDVPIQPTIRHGGTSTTNYGSAARMYVGAVTLWLDRRR